MKCRGKFLDRPVVEKLKFHFVVPATKALDEDSDRQLLVAELYDALAQVSSESLHGYEHSVRIVSQLSRVNSMGVAE